MVQKLEAIKGGGGSIKVGTTGTVSALMTRELESFKSASQTSVSQQDKPRTVPVSIPCSATTPRRSQARKSLDEASSSTNCRSPETSQKMKSYAKSAHKMPMLCSENYFNYMGMLAVEGSYDKMEALLSQNIHPVDILLMLAASEGDKPKIEELLRAGASYTVKDTDGRTALDRANEEIREFILQFSVQMA
ncbi:hypothetical protein GH714_008028 [Hevea brasiliensis]|uniref:Protein LHCP TRANSLOCATION DEFECT n=1 Tax=Hevea brasiliensis TaxID=3981 RepID=A0A6A6MXG0_HEVBR|nr:hypothetical protein GH714_008028 [Hevea brasiliensis]